MITVAVRDSIPAGRRKSTFAERDRQAAKTTYVYWSSNGSIFISLMEASVAIVRNSALSGDLRMTCFASARTASLLSGASLRQA